MESQQRLMAKTDAQDAALDPKEQRFVEEYLIDLDPRRAALVAGYSASMANSKAYMWVRDGKAKPHVFAAVEAAKAKRAEVTQITAEMVLARWWLIATADPNELIQHRRVNCRNCYGEDHHYQWKDADEYAAACAHALKEGITVPHDDGGYGYNPTLSPHARCPVCFGEGHAQVFAQDTKHLSPAAQALYAGVKQTKEGLEIKTHDQLKALDNVARHLGMFNDKLTLKGDPENPLVALIKEVQGKTLMPGGDDQ